jgi:hypothetical protein
MDGNRNDVKDFLENVGEMGSNALSVSKKMLEDGKEQVTLDMRRTKIMPERMESPARSHVFNEVDGFLEYLDENRTKNMLIFADVPNTVIYAVLDDKAEHGFEQVRFEALKHPEFTLLAKTLLDGEMDIMTFARNLMRNRNILAGDPEKAKQLALMMRQITVSSKITACSGVGAKSVTGIMCTTEAKAGVAEDQIDLPDSIAVKVPIYIDTAPVQFDIDLTMTAKRTGEVVVTTDNPELELRKYEVFQLIMEQVAAINGVIVTRGKPMTKEWVYNK